MTAADDPAKDSVRTDSGDRRQSKGDHAAKRRTRHGLGGRSNGCLFSRSATTRPGRARGTQSSSRFWRIGELLGLEVSDVDFLRRTIRVERQRAQSGELTPPKSKSSGRTVPVGQSVIDALAAYLKAGGRKSGPLFVNALGQPLTYRQWKPLWNAAAEVAKVEATAHALRHSYASALIAGGASVKQVQMVLGHASAVLTLRTYAHLWPGDDDRTRSIIDAIFSVSADQVRTDEVL